MTVSVHVRLPSRHNNGNTVGNVMRERGKGVLTSKEARSCPEVCQCMSDCHAKGRASREGSHNKVGWPSRHTPCLPTKVATSKPSASSRPTNQNGPNRRRRKQTVGHHHHHIRRQPQTWLAVLPSKAEDNRSSTAAPQRRSDRIRHLHGCELYAEKLGFEIPATERR